jgi:multidrug efflux pump subunit AcrA (membrane-fusion protein)
MTARAQNSGSRRSRVTSIALVVVLLVAAIVLRRPLVAWFTGASLGASEGKPIALVAGPFSIKAALDPDPPREHGNALVLEIQDLSGRPVEDATVSVDYDMAEMGTMPEMRGGSKISHESGGRYRAEFDLPMSSSWTLKSKIHASQGDVSQDFTMTVGSPGLSIGNSSNASTPGGKPDSPGEIDHYTCSMHPSVKKKTPGTCPICGMDLIGVTKEQQEQGVVMIDEARRQLIGVRTAPVVEAPMSTVFRAIGQVAYDETGLSDVNIKVHGWITKLLVSRMGERVTRGQTLFMLYSPELYNAEQDFLLATQRGASGAMPDGGSRVDYLAKAARQRLRLLGLSDALIDDVTKKGAPDESVAFAAPASGFVIEKNVVEGASVDAGMRLYRIAALSKVWVEADVYETDLARARVGQDAKVTLDYLPGRSYDARVAYIYPYLDPKARTGRVRIELANKDLDLRPGMYANVELAANLGTRLQVPAAAVVYTGPRRLVFVDVGEGRFKPQEVQVGTESNGSYEVLGGLRAGDVVATSGVFLIAAEARISTAAKYWESRSDDTIDAGPAPASSAAPSSMSTALAMPMHPMDTRPPAPLPRPPPSAPPSPRSSPADSSAPAPAATFSCPMHPEVQSPVPGKCPKCGMDLVPHPGAR